MSDDLVISYSGLQNAANSYSSAATKFAAAAENMISALNKTSEVWKDASSVEWQSKITKAKNTFDAVAKKLQNSSAVLTSINDAVSTASGNVHTAVSEM